MIELKICNSLCLLILKLRGCPALVGVLIDSARIDTLWMCVGKCGVAIGAAYRPLLSIHVVSGSVHREGLATRGLASSPEALLGVAALLPMLRVLMQCVITDKTNYKS